MEFSRQDNWSGQPFSFAEDLPNPGMEPWSPASQADSLPFELQGSPPSTHRTLYMITRAKMDFLINGGFTDQPKGFQVKITMQI